MRRIFSLLTRQAKMGNVSVCRYQKEKPAKEKQEEGKRALDKIEEEKGKHKYKTIFQALQIFEISEEQRDNIVEYSSGYINSKEFPPN